MFRTNRLPSAAALAILLALMLGACDLLRQDKVNRENYDRIETDMTKNEVYRILGEPDDSNALALGEFSVTSARWVGEEQTITIGFSKDRVKFKRLAPNVSTQQDPAPN